MTNSTTHTGPIDTVCRYLVKKGHEAAFADLVRDHWGILNAQGLTTSAPARVLKVRDGAENTAFIEMFAWKDSESIQSAHESAAVMKAWEPMGALCENMEFWHVEEG